MATKPNCIIAYVNDDDRYQSLVNEAIRTAQVAKARLILYDADATSRTSDGLPGFWSRQQELSGGRLSPYQLEIAGRGRLAGLVRRARFSGVEAYGWLAPSRDSEALAQYAEQQHADIIIVPDDLEDRTLLQPHRDVPPCESVVEATDLPAVVVHTGENR